MPLLNPLVPIVLFCRSAAFFGKGCFAIKQVVNNGFLPTKVPAYKNYTPAETDLFVTTFVKSGTNWALQMGVQLADRGKAEFGHIHEICPWPEAPMPDVVPLDGPHAPSATGLRVIKTHCDASLVPYNEKARYFTLIRDPKEVLVSAYHFMTGVVGVRHRVSPADWWESWFDPGFLGDKWAEHTAGFWSWRDRPNVHVQTFTEAKRDLEGTIKAVAALVGVELSPEELAAVVQRSSFAHMRAHDSQFAPGPFPFKKADQFPSMIRRGEAGKSDELLNPEQQARIDAHARERLQALGSDFPYDELFGSS